MHTLHGNTLPLGEPRAQVFQDNGGFFHLAILDGAGKCVYYLADADRGLVKKTYADFLAGQDPILDGWKGGEKHPQRCYESILRFVEARNGSAWPVYLEDS